MTKSALQIARAAYQPKVPAALKGAVKAVDGEYTQSVADQDEIKKLFPNTYGMPVVTFEKSNEKKELPAMNVGVILSGGQAPGGHNVIAGLFGVLIVQKSVIIAHWLNMILFLLPCVTVIVLRSANIAIELQKLNE